MKTKKKKKKKKIKTPLQIYDLLSPPLNNFFFKTFQLITELIP
jgi:hypothetical protein